MSWHKPHRTTLIHQAVLVSLLGTSSLAAHAVTLGQANVTSSQNEPLSATIEVTDIDAKNFNASVATADIYQQLGLSADAKISVHFTPTSATSGQIILSSKSPIATPFADVVLNLNNNGEQVIEPQTLLMPLPSGSSFTLPETNGQILASDPYQNLPIAGVYDTSDAIDTAQTPTPPTVGKKSSNKTKVENTNVQARTLKEQAHQLKEVGETDDFNNSQTPQAGTGSYKVQSGDNLWSIANQIAKANNLKVGDVMKAIHAVNPDAFQGGKMSHLKANANLQLPDYKTIPSQKAIQEAINTKRHVEKQTTARSTQKGKKSEVHHKTGKAIKAEVHHRKNVHKPARKALPKAQVTLVTPTQQGKATGTNTVATQNASAGGTSNLVGTLQNTRQKTAASAKRVNGLNQELSVAAQKLQLQNQKLAELEARLKTLKNTK
ncbi:MAG: hypothetical protein D8B60_02920 [Moraxella sp.]|nr:MAG: hypothetical protein D8B60_02920 [Moraxella sp.]